MIVLSSIAFQTSGQNLGRVIRDAEYRTLRMLDHLTHNTGSKPANSEVDVPLNYADYYYLEALLLKKQLK